MRITKMPKVWMVKVKAKHTTKPFVKYPGFIKLLVFADNKKTAESAVTTELSGFPQKYVEFKVINIMPVSANYLIV